MVTLEIAWNFNKYKFASQSSKHTKSHETLHSLLFNRLWLHHSCLMYSLLSQLKQWSQDLAMMCFHWLFYNSKHNMQSTRFTNPAYPHYQHVEVLSNRYLPAANGLKSVILISKHLTLEWWLLAGGYPCCLSRLHLKKMTELLSDTYSTASVQ